MEEHTYHTYYQYLHSGNYTDGLNKEKGDIRKNCEQFCVQDEYLMHKQRRNGEVQLRQVLMKADVSRVVKACHEGFFWGGYIWGEIKQLAR